METSVIKRFEAQVMLNPNKVAVTSGDQEITYSQLNSRANRLARLLVSCGVGPDSLIAVIMPHSIELIITLLATVKAGGAYLPINPSYPAGRISYMLKDASPLLTIVTEYAFDDLDETIDTPVIDTKDAETLKILAENPDSDLQPEELNAFPATQNSMYVIYTSGSTGRPKGVVVSYGSVASLFNAADQSFSFFTEDVWTWFHSIAFDFSVWEVWGSLLHGGRLVVVPFDVSRSPQDFVELITREKVSILSQTPLAFYQLIDAEMQSSYASLPSLRLIILGGENLVMKRLTDWLSRYDLNGPALVNMYGITETTVHVTNFTLNLAKCRTENGLSVIGRSLPGLKTYVLDPSLHLAPAGMAGELYVAGAQLARGYLNRAALTAERFIPCPFGPPGERMYKTGDVVRLRQDGNLEFLGRVDDQIKIRGFRIEPGELEAALAAHKGVAQAAVLAHENRSGEKSLVGYVVPRPGGDLEVAELCSTLATLLPDYMLPAELIILDKLPLTPNGKLDRSALPPPGLPSSGAEFSPPRTSREEILCEIFANVLNVKDVGIHDSFFALGGHSLLAGRLVSRARPVLGPQFTIRALFEAPTVAALVQQFPYDPEGGSSAGDGKAPILRPSASRADRSFGA